MFFPPLSSVWNAHVVYMMQMPPMAVTTLGAVMRARVVVLGLIKDTVIMTTFLS